MLHFLHSLISTVIFRPYVFIFFACYLWLAITTIGWRRTALFTVLAYLVAFVCEWSSAVAATGFPFGLYYYLPVTLDRELWIAGVPFMDSLSFTFLSYVSWEVATILLGEVKIGRFDLQVTNGEQVRRSWAAALLASFLMMYLDIVIDPVALRGDRWFLGKIYYYPEGGLYFGITIANFLGWYFVCLVIIRTFVWVDRLVSRRWSGLRAGILDYRFKALGPIGLYLGVLGFNLFMTFWIGEIMLGTVGIIIILPLTVMILLGISRGRRVQVEV
ncbi:MAG TPA: carotenoid biosynthesis protein [Blastocatellia bacterium]|nr:carotenoid biosynthesis protein [Blastocatellia bacterium]